LDRLSGYAGVVIVALLAIIAGWRLINNSVLFSIGLISAILAIILLGLFNPFLYSKINQFLELLPFGKISRSLKNLHQQIHIFKQHRKTLLYNLMLSLFIQATGPIIFYFIALALGVRINILYFFIFVPIIGAITLLPISIGGLGLREAVVIFFFTQAGVSKDLAFATSIISFFFILIYSALGGLIYVLRVRYRRI
jgi:hypothetical protein